MAANLELDCPTVIEWHKQRFSPVMSAVFYCGFQSHGWILRTCKQRGLLIGGKGLSQSACATSMTLNGVWAEQPSAGLNRWL